MLMCALAASHAPRPFLVLDKQPAQLTHECGRTEPHERSNDFTHSILKSTTWPS